MKIFDGKLVDRKLTSFDRKNSSFWWEIKGLVEKKWIFCQKIIEILMEN